MRRKNGGCPGPCLPFPSWISQSGGQSQSGEAEGGRGERLSAGPGPLAQSRKRWRRAREGEEPLPGTATWASGFPAPIPSHPTCCCGDPRETTVPSPVLRPCSSFEGRLGRGAATKRNRMLLGRRKEDREETPCWPWSGRKPVLVGDT